MLFTHTRLALAATITISASVAPSIGQGHVVKLGNKTTAEKISKCAEVFSVADYRAYAKGVYAREKVSKRAHARLKRMHECQHSWRARIRVGKIHYYLKAKRKQRKLSEACTPFGQWAIPAYIVMRESGGRNVQEASGASDASGYYQILDSTWLGAGGRDRGVNYQAMHAPKAEQDCVAHRLWNGGNNNHWALTR